MGKRVRQAIIAAAGLAAAVSSVGLQAGPPSDWSKIPTKSVKLFYPGQSTYEWLVGPEHKKSAQRKVAEGAACTSCHVDEEADIGKLTVSGQRLEPAKLDGKQPTIDLKVQAAYDDKNLYWRFEWKTKNNFPGTAYPFYRFDGKEWKKYGQPRLDKEAQAGKVPAVYEDRLTIMLDDGKVARFKEQGCWLTCHDGMRDTAVEASKAAVKANPLIGQTLKKTDVRKYLPASRTDANASWDKTKSPEEIAKLKAAGQFVDLMQWRAHRSNPVGMADDGYVLEYRLFDEGKNMFSSNLDKEKKQPKYMFDAGKVGAKSVTAGKMRDPKGPQTLVPGQTAVPFDPAAGWKEGDLLPQYYINRADAKGSAADNTDVKGSWGNGAWTVVWARPLDTGHPQDDKILKAGGVYTLGFAVHDDNITTRGHHVSFPVTLGLGAKADIQAVKTR
ncbi:MAG: hypothetical protein A2150_05800 [Candidatus Muproteobacteria bacterium RBG_16_64_11]|uniref:Cytochrome c-552/DMSO reductase-like haem-binding domain-containing protein n=1 Tax=Candidatus Muproteobacteria bacterium RBG_16_64_11 TaxID=1817758 RepID=A0A1F6TEW4_9PROT|nr:MAG: hypothetical protein A2150_05800 [Candidatus Muproteobacteria bacterium RBG_16_64_11]